jgi:predicted glycosyltransferase
MKILFDIVHPAHVHFFKHMIHALRQRGHVIAIVAREKDVTSSLLDRLGLDHDTIGRAGRKTHFGQLTELVRRDLELARFAHRFRAGLIVTRNPAGVQAARIAGIKGIFDTDDGSAAGIHFRAARPFAHYLTSPDCLPEDWGRRHVKYQGYKQSAYLHPDHFKPNPNVLKDLGLDAGARYFVVRFVAMHASHDDGESGMPAEVKRIALDRLQRRGKVFLSCEGGVPREWEHLAFRLAPDRLHDLLAFASLVVGDSQTIAAEAAVLGTPSIRASTFAGRISYLEELEHRYGLTFGFRPEDAAEFLRKLDWLLDAEDPRALVADGHRRMLGEKVNVARWFTDFIERVGARA